MTLGGTKGRANLAVENRDYQYTVCSGAALSTDLAWYSGELENIRVAAVDSKHKGRVGKRRGERSTSGSCGTGADTLADNLL